MSDDKKDLSPIAEHEVARVNNDYENFASKLVRLNALACNRCNDDLNIEKAEQESLGGIKVLNAEVGLQAMLLRPAQFNT